MKMLSSKLAQILLVVILPLVFTQTNYCDKSLCGDNRKHVACNNNGAFQAACGENPKVIEMTPELRKQILDKHNELRSQVAQGFDKFKPAVRMATMEWSTELANLAEFNVKQCELKHDQCRNTKDFPYAGQNLAHTGWMGKELSVTNIIDSQIQSWFDEYKVSTIDDINKYPSNTDGRVIGHFTVIVQDKSTHIGCAIVRHKNSNDFTEQFMTCNYAVANIIDRQVYKTGPDASQCKSGNNPNYKSLCSLEEQYNF